MTSRDFVLAFLVVLLLIVGYVVYLYRTRGPPVPDPIDPRSVVVALS
jgi:hypothetical protein